MKLLSGFWLPAIASGLLMGVSFPPLDLGWLMPLAWALLFLSMRLRRGARGGWQGFVAALALFGPGISWMVPLAWPLWLVVVLWCAMWEGFFTRLAGRVFARDGGPPAAWIVVLPMAHLAADMARTLVLTGFPWLLTGYAAWKNPVLLGSADLIGVHGASLATLMLGAAIAECAARMLRKEPGAARPFVPAAALWAVFAVWAFAKPALVESDGPTFLLLQPAIPQQWKEDRIKKGEAAPTKETFWTRQEDIARRGLAACAAEGTKVDAVVWAETMIPADAERPFVAGSPLVTLFIDESQNLARTQADGRRVAAASGGARTLAGIASWKQTAEGRLVGRNSVVLLDDAGRVLGAQDKQHLTPGGEYIPLVFLMPFRKQFEKYLEEALGFVPALEPGEGPLLLSPSPGAPAGVLICYESLFPEIPRRMVGDGALLLINVSNYGWFSGTAEMPQAFAVCAFRAAELRRTFVLSSNNGISAVIGPDGRVRASTAADEEGFLVARTTLCRSKSPFAAIGEWGAWALGVLGAVLAACCGRRKVPSESASVTPDGSSARGGQVSS